MIHKHIRLSLKRKVLSTTAIIAGFSLLAAFIISFRFFEKLDFGEVTLSVATFLFGMFLSFTISDRHARIEKIRETDSADRSATADLVYLAGIFSKGLQRKTADLFDKYLQATLDYMINDYEQTEEEFNAVAKQIAAVEPKTPKESEIYKRMLDALSTLRAAREHAITIIDDRLEFSEWLNFIILSGIIIVSTRFIYTGTMASAVLLFALNLLVVLFLVFLYDLDRLSYKEEVRLFEPYERTFESIGKLRYYPEDLIQRNRVAPPKEAYRIGIFPRKYPDMRGKRIRIIKSK